MISPAIRAYLRQLVSNPDLETVGISSSHLRDLLDATEWRPISTAPKDGTRILVYAAEREGLPAFQCVAAWHTDGGWCVDELREATHWHPLLAPPGGSDDAR